MAKVTITVEIPGDRPASWGEVRDGIAMVTPMSSTLMVGELSAPIDIKRGGLNYSVRVET